MKNKGSKNHINRNENSELKKINLFKKIKNKFFKKAIPSDSILVAGLGNPGPKYLLTRHNIGFRFIDYFSEKYNTGLNKSKFRGDWGKITLNERDIYLLKPQKFMNLSGEVIIPFCSFFKISVDNLIVIHDEIELPFLDVRIKKGGGHKGHNGLRNIIQLGSVGDFWRIRCGVGRPHSSDIADYVLSPFSDDEDIQLEEVLQKIDSKLQEILNSISKSQK